MLFQQKISMIKGVNKTYFRRLYYRKFDMIKKDVHAIYDGCYTGYCDFCADKMCE